MYKLIPSVVPDSLYIDFMKKSTYGYRHRCKALNNSGIILLMTISKEFIFITL